MKSTKLLTLSVSLISAFAISSCAKSGGGEPSGPTEPTAVTINGVASLKVEDTATFTASVIPTDAPQEVTWSSSDDTILTITAAGVATGVAEGTATVTAACKDYPSIKATASVQVLKKGDDKPTSVSFEFWHTFGDKAETALGNKVEEFTQLVKDNEGVDVTVTLYHLGGYNDVITQVGTALTAGNGPAMTISYPDSIASIMKTHANSVVKLDDYFNSEEYGLGKDAYLGDDNPDIDDFIQSYLEEGRQFDVEGTYVVPYMKSSEIMLYNLDAVTTVMKAYKPSIGGSQAEIKEYMSSLSWAELIEIAKYAVDNKAALGLDAMEYPIFYDSDSNMLITQLEQKGLKYSYLENGQVVLGLDKNANRENYEAVAALLGEYRDWHQKGYITTKNTEGEYASDSFKNKKCLFTIGSSGGAGYSFPEQGTFELGICKVPYSSQEEDSDMTRYISQGPSIAFLNNKSISETENKYKLLYAWKLYKFITNTDNNVELCVNGSEGYVPVRNSCYESEDWAAFLEEGGDFALAAEILRYDIGDRYISSLVFKGSAAYRDQMTGLVGATMSKTTSIFDLIDTAVSNTKNAM